MKKKTLKLLGFLLGMFLITSSIFAQNDCDCPEPTEADGVCVAIDFSCGGDSTVSIKDTVWMPSECYAICSGFEQNDIIGNCTWEDVYGEPDTTWTDCDCPEPTEADGVCILVSTPFSSQDTTWMPSECLALCAGFTQDDIVGNCTWEDIFGNPDTTWTNCDCPEPTEADGVCILVSTPFNSQDTTWMPSECLALCAGFTQDDIIGSCTWEDVYGEPDTTWTNCDCPEPVDSEGICVVMTYWKDSSTFVVDTTWMPSECYALCAGFTQNDIVGNCSWEDIFGNPDTTWTNCDCPEPIDSEGVCVVMTYWKDSSTFVVDTTWMPSECYALCAGFTQNDIIGNCSWEDIFGNPDTTWTNCDCPEPTDSEGVCVVYTFNTDSTTTVRDTFWMPSECEALCKGFTQDDIIGNCSWEDVFGDSDNPWSDCNCPEPVEGDEVCVSGSYYDVDSVLIAKDTFMMPSECIALCYGFTQEQILDDCDPESSNSYFVLANKSIEKEEAKITLYPNPVNDYFTIDISSMKAKDVTTTISGIDGRIVYNKTIRNHTSKLDVNASSFKSGLYIVNIKTDKTNKTLRMIKF